MINAKRLFMFFATAGWVVGVAFAGDLNPPAGPVGSTFKTLDEVEPRRPIDPSMAPITINSSGSYYLTGEMRPTGPGQTAVIEIIASNVSLDLRGFTVFGSSGMGTATDCIRVTGAENVEIFGGTVALAIDRGINANPTTGVVVRDVRAHSCGGRGISLAATGIVDACIARNCGAEGIFVGNDGVVTHCVANSNTLEGFKVGGATVVACTARENKGDGFDLGVGSRIWGCTALFNEAQGFSSIGGCIYESCDSIGNGGSGFSNAGNSVYRSCFAQFNDGSGFRFTHDCHLIACYSQANVVAGVLEGSIVCTVGGAVLIDTYVDATPSAVGIALGDDAYVRGCVVSDIGNDGIVAGIGAIIDGCLIRNCEGNGIEVDSGCIVRNNLCYGNGGGAGVNASGGRNRIEENVCRSNATGITTAAANNMVVKNLAYSNGTDYDFMAATNAGAIQVDASVSGPWDNFE